MPQPLARIVEQLKREPSRTGSIVITVFGDAIVPRGGSVWLGTLLEFFAAIDIDSGVVPHRDVAAGDRRLAGAQQGRPQQFLPARTRRDGRPSTPPPDTSTIRRFPTGPGGLSCLLIGNGEDRDASRDALKNAGFGSPLPGVWVAPSGVPVPEEAAGAIRLEVSAEDESGRRLLSESWPLERTADAYLKFMKTFEPLRAAMARGEALSDSDAFTARILLIHHYRRVVLRDPLLPAPLLPRDWPGRAARRLCGEIYRGLLSASEQWLDEHATNENGPLPKPGGALARRFDGA
jgi:phenylacetic acid degradation operon negative regulatory protein